MKIPLLIVSIALSLANLAAHATEPVPAKSGAADPQCGEPVSLAALIADPGAYHGKSIWVVAKVTIEFENMTACPSENETARERCLWLNIDDGPFKTDADYARYLSKRQVWERFDRQTLAIRARFDKALKGHFNMWPGGLGNVTEIAAPQSGWSFTANAAVPRSACAGELPPALPEDNR